MCETSQPPYLGLLQWLSGKESTCNVGDPDSIPGSGRSPGDGPLYLENLDQNKPLTSEGVCGQVGWVNLLRRY